MRVDRCCSRGLSGLLPSEPDPGTLERPGTERNTGTPGCASRRRRATGAAPALGGGADQLPAPVRFEPAGRRAQCPPPSLTARPDPPAGTLEQAGTLAVPASVPGCKTSNRLKVRLRRFPARSAEVASGLERWNTDFFFFLTGEERVPPQTPTPHALGDTSAPTTVRPAQMRIGECECSSVPRFCDHRQSR